MQLKGLLIRYHGFVATTIGCHFSLLKMTLLEDKTGEDYVYALKWHRNDFNRRVFLRAWGKSKEQSSRSKAQ